jgi:hypothetical protein
MVFYRQYVLPVPWTQSGIGLHLLTDWQDLKACEINEAGFLPSACSRIGLVARPKHVSIPLPFSLPPTGLLLIALQRHMG